jgi:hypothetical protein
MEVLQEDKRVEEALFSLGQVLGIIQKEKWPVGGDERLKATVTCAFGQRSLKSDSIEASLRRG